MRLLLPLCLCLLLSAGPSQAFQIYRDDMSVDRIGLILESIAEDVRRRGNSYTAYLEGQQVQVITDPRADRMRIMIPITASDNLAVPLLERLLQANFDTALDARYAIARDILWATYIHPLSPLDDDQFLSGLAQTINTALTFGSTFSSGALSFGGGDSNGLLKDFKKRWRPT